MDGVVLTPLKRIPTGKGDVMHAIKTTDNGFCGFGEVYFTEIFAHQTKGWKRHKRLTLNLVVVSGEVRFYIYNEQTGERQTIDLSAEKNYQRLTLQPMLWMAFEGLGEQKSILMDLIAEPHDTAEAETRDLSWQKLS